MRGVMRIIWKIIDRLLLKLFLKRMDAEGKWLVRHEDRIFKKYDDLVKELALKPVDDRHLDELKSGLERDCREVIDQAQFIPPERRESALSVLMISVARRGKEEAEEKKELSDKKIFH